MSIINPQQIEVSLENEIKKRINENDLTKNDIEYYQRKIRRIENQYSICQDELIKLKVKLKRSQEYQNKYQLLFKQNNQLKNDLEQKNQEINMMKYTVEQLSIKLEEKNVQDKDFTSERKKLLAEIQQAKEKYDALKQRTSKQIENEKIRFQQIFKREQDKLKNEYSQRQQDYQFQIRQLKKAIHQKQTVEQIINQRVEKIRGEKDDQIQRLKGIIEHKRVSYDEYMREKDEQLERMKDKFEKIINFDIENLKNNLDDQEQIFSIELNGLREMIGLKNDEIEKLLGEVRRQAKEHEANRKELLKEISLLKEKVYMVEKQSQTQLINLKQRLIMIHKQDIKTIQQRHDKIVDSLKESLEDTRRYISELQKIRQRERVQGQRMVSEMNDRLKQKDKRILELGENIKQRGQLNASEMKILHESFHKIESEKQILASEYQNNITFLNMQISKLSTTNQVKTSEIKKLNEEIYELRLSYQERLREIQSKFRRERKDREEEKEEERVQRDKLKQTVEGLEREMKNRQRRFEREIEKIQKEKNKIKYMLEESQRDIQRLNKYIKQLDDSLKNEFKKNQLSTLDKDGLRREVLSQLQKQKVELQALKLMEIDQMRKRYEMEFARLSTMNEQLQTDLLNKTIAFDQLDSEFKKLDYKNRNADKLQKDKIKEYETKMMTLNQEIFITQNLYKTFLEAKARAEQ